MENRERTTDQLELAAAHARLLADLILAGARLQEVDCSALASVLQDFSQKLQRAAREMKESRP